MATPAFNDTAKKAFLAFYLDLYRDNELDPLNMIDSAHQIPQLNEYITLEPQVTKETLLADVLTHCQAEVNTLLQAIVKFDAKAKSLKTKAAWHAWYLKMIDKVAQRTSRD